MIANGGGLGYDKFHPNSPRRSWFFVGPWGQAQRLRALPAQYRNEY